MPASIWKGSISLGLLNIPVQLLTAQQGRELHFKLLDSKDLSPIKYRKINSRSGEEVPYERIIKGYEYERGRFVTLTPDELKAANPKATQTIDIENFVSLDDIDPLLFERPYYLVPQKSGEKGYYLLRDALAQSRKVAIGKIVIRTKQHLAAIMPRENYLVLELLRFAHEIKEAHEAEYLKKEPKSPYTDREFRVAQELIDGMTDKWEPDKYRDTYYEDVMKMINKKVKGGKIATIAVREEKERAEEVIDLLPLLKKSLATKKGRGKGGRSRARA